MLSINNSILPECWLFNSSSCAVRKKMRKHSQKQFHMINTVLIQLYHVLVWKQPLNIHKEIHFWSEFETLNENVFQGMCYFQNQAFRTEIDIQGHISGDSGLWCAKKEKQSGFQRHPGIPLSKIHRKQQFNDSVILTFLTWMDRCQDHSDFAK